MVTVTFSLWLAAIGLLSLCKGTEAARRFDQRSDLDYVPPINSSAAAHWTVPLQGSRTCDATKPCAYLSNEPSLESH